MTFALPPSPVVMGIVNVTPDSFSDGGRWLEPERAVEHGLRLAAAGAAVLDLGAESTRPGAEPVPPAEEIERLRPVLAGLCEAGVPLCVDTRNASTAREALAGGATWINDVSGLRHDPELAAVAARAGAGLVLMHSRGTPETMDRLASYDDVVAEVAAELRRIRGEALEAGVPADRLVLDPGLGFAKERSHDLELLRRLPELKELLGGAPILVGASRKRLVGHLLARDGRPRPVEDRVAGSVGLALAAVAGGADWVRVHDVAETADALACYCAASGRGGVR